MSAAANPTRCNDPESTTNATETTPLLGQPEADAVAKGQQRDGSGNGLYSNGHHKLTEADESGSAEGSAEKPMPVLQILILCFVSLTDPISYFAIFPFIPEMVHRVGNLRQEEVGFWTGLIESLFSLVQMVLMIFYGRLADRYGRKPVLVWSLAGVSVFTALFGMSQTLWQMVLFRCCAGAFGGTVVTIRTMISENSTKGTQARAFSWYMFARNFGIFLGPLIGGPLANPVEQFPKTFEDSALFKQYPYALSTYTAGTFCILATLFAIFGLRETLKREEVRPGANSSKPMTTWEVIKSPGVGIVLYIFGHVSLLGLAYTAVSPVFLFTAVDKGGWGFSDQYIAIFLAVAGASQAAWMLLAFPAVQKRFGTGNILRGAAIFWPVLFVSFPFGNELLRHGLKTTFWIITPIFLVIGSGVSMAFACVQLAINDISPSSTVLATVNALSLTVASAVRAFSPIVFTSIYAVGVKSGWADGQLIWFVLVAAALGLNVAVAFLPNKADGRYDRSVENEPAAGIVGESESERDRSGN
ncbi:MFS general substrate transporter [Teratosphaeria nubilosa]|uniref:MFS general substrate transporter n=1 Tax=Teratosphaeria nubilosa TaxID=161662 RepID=A0A6G1L5H7_9PEZI|nr:MFS general substrate transporter [Teratosphaeria nubilosa]